MGMKINVDPSQLESAASRIETQCGSYEANYRQLYQIVNELSSGWKGKDNQSFTAQIKGFEADFIAMKQLMQDYASYLRRAAKAYRDTQSERASQARRLYN